MSKEIKDLRAQLREALNQLYQLERLCPDDPKLQEVIQDSEELLCRK